jgi:hypothetical protein
MHVMSVMHTVCDPSSVVVALKCVSPRKPGSLVDRYSATSLLRHTSLIFSVHILLSEVTRFEVKVGSVSCDKFRKSHVIYLSLVVQRVSVEETSFFGAMGVEVNIGIDTVLVLGVVSHDKLLYRVNLGRLAMDRIGVEPIQIGAISVMAEVPTIDPIWIYHWNNLENKVFSEQLRSWV